MVSQDTQSESENGLRILARWIARAHLKELAKQQGTVKGTSDNQTSEIKNKAIPTAIPVEDATYGVQTECPEKMSGNGSTKIKKIAMNETGETEATNE